MKRRTNVPSPVDSLVTQVEQLQQTDSSVEDGEFVWCRATQCLWVYRVNSGLVADGITVVASLYGNGVWQRLETSSAAGVAQLNWFIDPVNGNDSNNGLTAATALKTDAERQRRMGTYPLWNAGAYHLRYLNDLPATDTFVLAGRRESNSQIFVHGSAVDHQGKATLFTGTIDVLGTLNRATGTNESWLITASALPVSWTASGLINSRLRLTSGTPGAISGVMKDLTAKQARVCQFRAPVSYTVPVNPTSYFFNSTPVAGNTFVVESLVQIPTVLITIDAADTFAVNLGAPVIFDSLALGSGDMMFKCSDVIVFDGCVYTMFDLMGQSNELLLSGSIAVTGCFIGASHAVCALAAGFSAVDVLTETGSQQVIVDSDFMVQGGAFLVNGNVSWAHGAVFDSSREGINISAFGTFHGTTQAGTFFCWGKGNTGVGLRVGERYADYISGQVAGFTITGTGGDFSVRNVTSIRPFDDATGAYAAAAATTWANLAAATPGGFGGNVNDPIGGGQLVVAA